MSRYNFASLSSQDFEELVRDLLQAEWNVAVEAFKTGRDSGIDLRYASAYGGITIVQCKHYIASGYSKLLAHLRNTELPKVRRLSPERYVVVTSVGLTPANKDEIVAVMQPFVRGVGDVLGAQDLEGLLSRHPTVERVNFKLWLTSTAVLERVLHNAEVCHTDFEIDRIRRKLPLFVQNNAFPRASQLLDETRIAVISGAPGIGKTTLAEMLLYAHLEQGYEPVVIQGEVAEGKKFFKPGAKQIFYYDDFLGQTFLGDRKEYLGHNVDAAIVDFVEMVQRSDHGRFILTAREHILSNAFQISEKLAHSPLLQHKCVIELRDYSYAQKARILYNHLYFCSLSQQYKDVVLEDHFFLSIIKHEHFNPRLIEWLSTHARLRDVTPDKYRAHISHLLESPDSIWLHAFQNQISGSARHALLSMYTLGNWTEISNLEAAFTSLHRHSATKYNERTGAGDFRSALQELDGAFLSYSINHASFLNPSVREFVASVVSRDRETSEDLLTAAIRFMQIASLWKLSRSQPESELAKVLSSNTQLLFDALSRLLPGPFLRWERMRNGSRRGYPIDMGVESRIELLIEVAGAQQSSQLAVLAVQGGQQLIASWNHEFPEFYATIGLLEDIGASPWFLGHGGRDVYRSILDGILRVLSRANANDWLAVLPFPKKALEWTDADDAHLHGELEKYCEHGVDDEVQDRTTLDEKSDLRNALRKLAIEFGLDLASAIQTLDDEIAEREETPDVGERRSYGDSRPSTNEEVMTDEDVSQMFSTLRDGN